MGLIGLRALSYSLVDSKLLDPRVHRVRDIQAAVACQHDSMRQVEAAGFCALASYATQILAFVRELLDTIIRRADPDPIIPVDAQSDGATHAR